MTRNKRRRSRTRRLHGQSMSWRHLNDIICRHATVEVEEALIVVVGHYELTIIQYFILVFC